MSVFREAEIEWQGETYRFTPSNRLLRRIEREVPLAGYMSAAPFKLAIPDTAYILAEFIRAAGGVVNEDEISATLFDDVNQNKGAGYFAAVDALISALVPSIGTEKKAKAPAKKKAATGATDA